MRIGIIGSGFTGLAAAYTLLKSGYEVTLLEKDQQPGGLANGFSGENWDWSLEKHYHHLFVSDTAIRDLAKDIGHPLNFTRPITSTLTSSGIYQLDSPLSLLRFTPLPFWDRLRTGVGMAYLKLSPYWQPLERITAKQYILSTMGEKSWTTIWQPLFTGKFGELASQISASWLWARVYKRSSQLGYPEGGFDALTHSLVLAIKNLNGQFIFNVNVTKISLQNKLLQVSYNRTHLLFDQVICTLPTPQFINITPSLPRIYKQNLSHLSGIGAVNLVLSLKQPFLPKSIYWLNVNVPNFPFLAVVEHTNFISKTHYDNNHLIYIGNYLPSSHSFFNTTAAALAKEFLPFLQQINPEFKPSWINKAYIWKAPFAQPIVTTNYSYTIPDIITPIPNLYLANIQQVYPWDRGTNYAVELGQRAAHICLSHSH